MVTKEQALTCRLFKEISFPLDGKPNNPILAVKSTLFKLPKPVYWRANGKCKTWVTRPNEFKLPIKHGLYSYGYITHENAHLFEPA